MLTSILSNYRQTTPIGTGKIWLLCLALFLSGCSARTISIHQDSPSALQQIHQTYVQTVLSAQQDTQLHWHHGHAGNITVNNEGFPNVGLCHHWQQLVYQQVKPVVDRVGWHAVGIAINEGSYFEHHAVLIYDPRQIKLNQILRQPYSSKIYVLDPWRTGVAQIYSLGDWLDIPLIVRRPARLTQIIPKTDFKLSQRNGS